eukprot:613835-Rhodomonas_salina.2
MARSARAVSVTCGYRLTWDTYSHLHPMWATVTDGTTTKVNTNGTIAPAERSAQTICCRRKWQQSHAEMALMPGQIAPFPPKTEAKPAKKSGH